MDSSVLKSMSIGLLQARRARRRLLEWVLRGKRSVVEGGAFLLW
jgi:hypothetical protein